MHLDKRRKRTPVTNGGVRLDEDAVRGVKKSVGLFYLHLVSEGGVEA
jgi:hypothetical protein